MHLLLPITLGTASILTLVCIVLVARVGQARAVHKVSLGDGGAQDLIVRIRTHANFVEFVPLLLIVMGLLEMGGANRMFLAAFGGLLILFRIFHAIGMPRPAPNFFRASGAIGSFVLMIVAAVYGLVLASGGV